MKTSCRCPQPTFPAFMSNCTEDTGFGCFSQVFCATNILRLQKRMLLLSYETFILVSTCLLTTGSPIFPQASHPLLLLLFSEAPNWKESDKRWPKFRMHHWPSAAIDLPTGQHTPIYLTSKPSDLRQALWASISFTQSGCSSPLNTTHSSLGFFVSGLRG